MTLWFLRLFAAFRELERRHERLLLALGCAYAPTPMGTLDAVAVTARAVLPAFIRVEVASEVSADVAPGTVRIVLQERGRP